MPWRGPAIDGEEPSLGPLVCAWVEAHCVVPDGEFRGESFKISGWQETALMNLYQLHRDADQRYLPDARRKDWTRPNRAFIYDRGGQVVMPKKAGKGPFAAAWVCVEAGGPALFDGWATQRSAYRCADHGCRCGWEYLYLKGDPTAKPWPTPWVEVTAASEDQAGNVWRALLPMIREGPLGIQWPDVGDTRINLPSRGLIVPVTASPRSRRGARTTAAVQDEAQDWTRRNGGTKLAETQRDNLAGMGGRFLETDNAWDPSEGSVAEMTHSKSIGVYKLMGDAGPGSVRNRRERAKMISRLYATSWWVDQERISVEIDEKLAQGEVAAAERLYLNRIVPSEDRAVDPAAWEACRVTPRLVPERAEITLGVDGARSQDAFAVIATEIPSGYQWPVGIWERPPLAGDDYEHPLEEIDGAVTECFEQFRVWRTYIDPGAAAGNITALSDRWLGRWGKDKVVYWYMHRPVQAAQMVRRYVEAIINGEITHPGDETFDRHVQNARRRPARGADEDGLPLWVAAKEFPGSPLKMDAFAAAALSWEARRAAIGAGVDQPRKSAYEDQLCSCPNAIPTPHIRGSMCP